MPNSLSLRENRIAARQRFVATRETTDRLCLALRDGLIPWKTPIRNDDNAGLPRNVANGKPFTPISTLLLQTASQQAAFVGRWWGTLSNWQQLGGSIDQLSEPTIAFDENWHAIEVYCVDQVAGANVDRFHVHDHDVVTSDNADFVRTERLIDATEADIRVGVGDQHHLPNWDGYVPPNPWISFPNHVRGDYILLRPPKWRSSTASHFYTLLHEFVHWAEVRTAWLDDMPMRELVAEMGSGWIAAELGCPPCPCLISHKKWLDCWIRESQRNSDYFIRAANQAWTAMKFLLSIDTENQHC